MSMSFSRFKIFRSSEVQQAWINWIFNFFRECEPIEAKSSCEYSEFVGFKKCAISLKVWRK